MKISEIQESDVARFLRLEAGDYDSGELQAIMKAAKSYLVSYTGIPEAGAQTAGPTLDDYEDFYIAYMVLCQDMFDNRALTVENSGVNRVVESILGLHVRNLL